MLPHTKKMPSPWSLGKHTGFNVMLSLGINLLGLVGAIYMMQVYDRVLSSGSVPTLVGISIIALILYLFLGCLDYLRTTYLSTHSEKFADKHSEKAFQTALEANARDTHNLERRAAIEDLNTIRSFVGSKGYAAVFDVIWTPVFILFIFSLHAVLGVTALAATVFLIGLTLVKERISRKRIESESVRRMASRRELAHIQSHAELVRANGMAENMMQRWMSAERAARIEALDFEFKTAKYSTTSKTIRMIIQSMILGLGGFLAIQGHISPGAMIAASIVFTRTLAPVERILGSFTLFTKARQAWARVETWISEDQAHKIALPEPATSLSADITYLVPPGAEQPVLQGVRFELKAGDVLGIIGPSGSGKSSLAKALSGAWAVQSGSIALDQSDYNNWPQSQLGAAIGYMSQDCQLFDGTISENISGFQSYLDEDLVLQAAMMGCAHEMIMGLPQGYNTLVGPSGMSLSAGQRQRINLARALFGNPFVVVLDEPNSNLDDAGETALLDAIKTLKAANKVVIIVAHRKRILKDATKLCVLKNGSVGLFGPAKLVAQKLAGTPQTIPAKEQEQAAQAKEHSVTPEPSYQEAPLPAAPQPVISEPRYAEAAPVHELPPIQAVPVVPAAFQTVAQSQPYEAPVAQEPSYEAPAAQQPSYEPAIAQSSSYDFPAAQLIFDSSQSSNPYTQA